MSNTTDKFSDPCQQFLDDLDLWLGQALDEQQNAFMQAHQDACPSCQLEARLAGEIDSITRSLPPQQCPELQLPIAAKESGFRAPAAQGLLAQLLATWRQPLVFGPALALLLISGLLIQMQLSSVPEEPQVFVVNGQVYTPEEVIQAVEDLELALQYLSKYSNYTARLVSSELRESNFPLPQTPENSDVPAI